MSLFRLIFLISLLLVLSSCGYIYGDDGLIKSQKYDYLQARQTKPLELPTDLAHKSEADFTVVPNIGLKGEKAIYGRSLTQAAPIQLLAVLDNTRVDRKSDVPTVLVSDRLDFIWQTAKFFLEERSIKTTVIDEDEKVIISAWMPIEEGGIWLGLDGGDDLDLIRAKYKISISAGDIKGEHRLAVERTASQYREDDDLAWEDKPVTWQESADMMNLILSYYDTRIRVQQAKRQLKVMAGFKVELGQDSERNAALITSAKENLVWQKIPKVIGELGLKIIDRDRRQKTYFLEYEQEEPGFFANLFESESSNLPIEPGAYQLVVSEIGEQRVLTLKDGEGVALPTDIVVKLFPDLSRLFGDRR